MENEDAESMAKVEQELQQLMHPPVSPTRHPEPAPIAEYNAPATFTTPSFYPENMAVDPNDPFAATAASEATAAPSTADFAQLYDLEQQIRALQTELSLAKEENKRYKEELVELNQKRNNYREESTAVLDNMEMTVNFLMQESQSYLEELKQRNDAASFAQHFHRTFLQNEQRLAQGINRSFAVAVGSPAFSGNFFCLSEKHGLYYLLVVQTGQQASFTSVFHVISQLWADLLLTTQKTVSCEKLLEEYLYFGKKLLKDSAPNAQLKATCLLLDPEKGEGEIAGTDLPAYLAESLRVEALTEPTQAPPKVSNLGLLFANSVANAAVQPGSISFALAPGSALYVGAGQHRPANLKDALAAVRATDWEAQPLKIQQLFAPSTSHDFLLIGLRF
jgi:flagellar biosynthesis chaperone FliJ